MMKTTTILLAGSALLFASAAQSAVQNTRCDKTCLIGILNSYQASMLKHNITGIKVTQNFRSVENYLPIKLGEGYWTRINKIHDQIQVADPVTGQVVSVGSLDDGGKDAYYVLRLKVEPGKKVSQSEMLLVHDGETSFLQKDRNVKLNRVYTATVPVTQRSSREQMLKLVDGFTDAWQYKDENLTKFSADCAFLENNVQLQNPGYTTCGNMLEYHGKRGVPGTGNSPERGDASEPMRAGQPADPSIGRPALQGSQPWMRDRRYPLVDVEQGVVLAYHIQGGTPARAGEAVVYRRATPFTASSQSARRPPEQSGQAQQQPPPAQQQPAAGAASGPPPGSGAAYMAGLFKIINGELVRIDHFEWEGGPNASGGFVDGPPN